jgi:hypothetical protein
MNHESVDYVSLSFLFLVNYKEIKTFHNMLAVLVIQLEGRKLADRSA